ncbi:MAG: glycosyltransferase family 4 protein [Candidatus Latescibacteria bacterium]|nr:glycosyltransferase family 4 protein [Candidatus Latescibacterota bacterium]
MKVLFTGNIDNIAYSCAKFSRWLGVEAEVLVSSAEREVSHPFWEDGEAVAGPLMRTFDSPRGLGIPASLLQLRRIFKEYDVVVAMGMMGIAALVLTRPYLAIALGADMKELVFAKSLRGRLMDAAFRRAARLYYNDVDHLPAVAAKAYQAHYFPIPIDTDKYCPRPRPAGGEGLRLLHGSSLSWTLDWTTDKELHRRTLKRNDLFFEGLALFRGRHPSLPLQVTVPLWGPDKDQVQPLCQRLGVADCIDFVPPLTKPQLLEEYHRADAVVDQFNMPRLGYNAMEALSCGRPVLGYFTEELQRACYPELPPVLNADGAEAVCRRLEELLDPARRRELEVEGRRWIMAHHHWEPILRDLLDQCRALARPSP